MWCLRFYAEGLQGYEAAYEEGWRWIDAAKQEYSKMEEDILGL